MRNIELKAKVNDINAVEAKAKLLSDTPLEVIKQCDIFFHASNPDVPPGGRLKLRHFENGTGELIFYLREDTEGPKLSTYTKVDLDSKQLVQMRDILTSCNGVLGKVEKVRNLYLIGQTRIHIDRVVGLGDFMEFEVVLKANESLEHGNSIAKSLIKTFGLAEETLISGAYLDLLLKKNQLPS